MNEDLKPCPFCGGFPKLSHGKQIKIMIQDWHEKDEALFMPSTVTCSQCGASVTRSANVHDCGGVDQAFKASVVKTIEAWNTRTSAPLAPDPRDELIEQMVEVITKSAANKDLVRSIEQYEDWDGGAPCFGTAKNLDTIKTVSEEAAAILSAWQKFKEGKV